MRRYCLALLSVIVLGAAGLVVTPGVAHAGKLCGPVALKSKANGRYVTAELNYAGDRYGMLRARGDHIGPWERFELCQDIVVIGVPRAVVGTLRSLANNRYVSMEKGFSDNWNGMLRARATTVGPWEQFDIDSGNDPAHIRDWFGSKYVSAELNMPGPWTGMLRARADSVGPWEKFQIVAA